MEGGTPLTLAAEPIGRLAARLIEHAVSRPEGLIFVAQTASRAESIHRAVATLGPELLTLALPAWDCLPYDRTSPSRQIMGTRMDTAHRLAGRDRQPVVVCAAVDAAIQRLPPPAAWRALTLRVGDPFDEDGIGRQLEALGYVLDGVVDEPGEAAIRGAVLDVFPAAASVPYRIEHDDDRIVDIRAYDPSTQRSRETVQALTLGPAAELVPPDGETFEREPGMEHALAQHVPGLVTLFDLLPDALLVLDPEIDALGEQRFADIAEAFESLLALKSQAPVVSPPSALYLDPAAWQAGLRRPSVLHLVADAGAEGARRLPRLDLAALPGFVRDRLAAGARVGIAGPVGPRRSLLRALARSFGASLPSAEGWLALREAEPGTLTLLGGELDQGFVDEEAVVIAPADVLGPLPMRGTATTSSAFEIALAPGDAVIHIDHGVAALRGIETIEQADHLRLAYAADTGLLVSTGEIGRLWRYGAEAGSVTLDRLNTETWAKRRAAIEEDIAATARRLVALTREQERLEAPVLRPKRGAYERFVARFGFTPTPDQRTAIAAVEEDLASGHPMERLLCGDVGYGKTEVALRAAAIAALEGWQVALGAPTTVLVRQHLQTFRRRFAGLGVRVAGLSRLSCPSDAKATRAGLADGSIDVVIGTQALAGKEVRFQKLGLLIIDEEQRFGVRQKTALRRLRQGVHVLTMTATPIPRTLQGALAGLQRLSVLTTPPARRQPVRTVRLELDPAVLVQALQAEKRRGGQSFVVCPRIEDIEPMRDRLHRLVPHLSVVAVHGAMGAEEMDEAMVRFAGGDGDVLLATNIVEAGLDVPRANTMVIWRPDRFGLAQLHQLRGRVGRGRARGSVYLLTEPGAPLTPTASKRLDALVSQDRLGAGFAISARDLDLRGAGDLLGEDQAGHVKLIGLDLYRHMLRRALCLARDEPPPEEWLPETTFDAPAFLPDDYVQEPALRVSLHVRLAEAARAGDGPAIDRLEEEIEDRFGPLPSPVEALIAQARLRAACRRLGVLRLDAGPEAVAATLRHGSPADPPAPIELRGERLVLPRTSKTPAERVAVAEQLLDLLEGWGGSKMGGAA